MDKDMLEFSEEPTFWTVILKPMTGIVVISEEVARIKVVIWKADKHLPYGEVFGTAECVTL
jgi:hypothetical protein